MPESAAEMVNVKLPSRVGVPLKTPAVLSVNPVGSALALAENVYGERPPLAVRFALKGMPTRIGGSVSGSQVTGGAGSIVTVKFLVTVCDLPSRRVIVDV